MARAGSAEDVLPRQDEQRLLALAKANEVRVARARLKRELGAGRIDLASVLLSPPSFVKTVTVSELLLAVPGVGPARVRRLLRRSRISEMGTVARMSERQRSELLRLLDPQ